MKMDFNGRARFRSRDSANQFNLSGVDTTAPQTLRSNYGASHFRLLEDGGDERSILDCVFDYSLALIGFRMWKCQGCKNNHARFKRADNFVWTTLDQDDQPCCIKRTLVLRALRYITIDLSDFIDITDNYRASTSAAGYRFCIVIKFGIWTRVLCVQNWHNNPRSNKGE